jgi:RND family efflux transporter MFP subunit
MSRVLPVSVALLLACPGAKAPAEKVATAVKVRQLEKGSSAQTARYSATVNAASRVELAFRMGGYVDAIAQVKGVDGALRDLQDGDKVHPGMELARVRQSDFEQKVAEARAAQAEAIAARSQAQKDYERAQRLFNSASISRAELDAAKAKAHTATARVEGAKARAAEAQTALGDAALESPIDGVVLKRSVEKGALVTPGQPCFSIADTSKVKVMFNVADTALERLTMGSNQPVTTEAYRGRTFLGQISRVAPNADAKSHLFEVEVTIPNPDDALKPGMVAALNLPTRPGETPTPLVPLTAVVRSPHDPKGFAVYVVDGSDDDTKVRVRDVELGSFVGNAIPVRSGLKEGERVVVMGASLLSDGMAVQIIP